MWNGKNKALTFSFDDGVMQDIRCIEILNKYGLKATFNINSSLLGTKGQITYDGGQIVEHNKIPVGDVKKVYENHEVASHTLSHPRLTLMDEKSIIWQVERDKKAIEDLVGYEVVGMAYPCGGENNDERVRKVIRENTGVKYSRTITSNYSFDLQTDLIGFNPTVHYIANNLFDIGKKFLELKTDKPQIMYIWGHSYEMDIGYITWEKFEEFCKMMSEKGDIFYGTNKEVLL